MGGGGFPFGQDGGRCVLFCLDTEVGASKTAHRPAFSLGKERTDRAGTRTPGQDPAARQHRSKGGLAPLLSVPRGFPADYSPAAHSTGPHGTRAVYDFATEKGGQCTILGRNCTLPPGLRREIVHCPHGIHGPALGFRYFYQRGFPFGSLWSAGLPLCSRRRSVRAFLPRYCGWCV